MKYCVVFSEKDPASMNIKEQILKFRNFSPKEDILQNQDISLVTVPEESIACDDIDQRIEADVFVFATRHESKKGVPSLCVHVPGNWGRASFGGRDFMLCKAPANLMRKALVILKKKALDMDFEVMPEATHHGPYLKKPCMFIEIGSTPDEWKDKHAGAIIAETIIELLEKEKDNESGHAALGIGGLHHAPKFRNLILDKGISFGHICPKYNLENLNADMILQAIETTMEETVTIYLDWKGFGGEKQRILKLLTQMHLGYEKVK